MNSLRRVFGNSGPVFAEPTEEELAAFATNTQAAYAFAQAAVEGREALRPNKALCLIGDPTVAIAAGAATGTLSVTLKEGEIFRASSCSPGMLDTWVCSALTFDGKTVLGDNAYINMSAFQAQLAETLTVTPAYGQRVWGKDVTVAANFLNVSAAAAPFLGVNLYVIDYECMAQHGKMKPGKGFGVWPALHRVADIVCGAFGGFGPGTCQGKGE